MEKRIRRGVAVLAAAAAVAIGVAGNTSAAAAAGQQAFGITNDGRLMVAFNTATPEVLDWVRVPAGLVGDTALIGLDMRVQDGKLYVVGNRGGIYLVTIWAPNVTLTKVSQLTIQLHGTTFGVDFNPAADRLRVISDTGQNLRHDLNTHITVQDTTLSPQLNGPAAAGVTAAAYTNNDLDPTTATTLFDLNTHTDQVVIQSPANNGLLAPTGALGVNAATNAGFDVFSDLSNGKTVAAAGFATLVSSTGTATLYTVNLLAEEHREVQHAGTFPRVGGDPAKIG